MLLEDPCGQFDCQAKIANLVQGPSTDDRHDGLSAPDHGLWRYLQQSGHQNGPKNVFVTDEYIEENTLTTNSHFALGKRKAGLKSGSVN